MFNLSVRLDAKDVFVSASSRRSTCMPAAARVRCSRCVHHEAQLPTTCPAAQLPVLDDPVLQAQIVAWSTKVAAIEGIVKERGVEFRRVRIAALRREMQVIADSLPASVAEQLEAWLRWQRVARVAQREARLRAARDAGPHIVIDCSFATEHCRPGQETTSLAKQVEWAMAFNRRSERPVSLHTTSWQGPVAAAAARINSHTWDVTCHTQPLLQVFTPEQVVMLSPDAEHPLVGLQPGRVYVIGGIVDRTIHKQLTADYAKAHGLELRRLPVAELAGRLGMDAPGVNRCPVLNVSDVANALIEHHRCGDWVAALDLCIPRRKRNTQVPRPKQSRVSRLVTCC
ncbi:hypothetical protein V8C86DRAFT_2795832 [Haematococcus lacustris]